MQVELSPDLAARFTQLALASGREPGILLQEALERIVSYDEWVIQEVEKGLAAADRGEFIDHEEVKRMIDLRYPA